LGSKNSQHNFQAQASVLEADSRLSFGSLPNRPGDLRWNVAYLNSLNRRKAWQRPDAFLKPVGQSNARSSDCSPRADHCKPWQRYAAAGWDSERARRPVAAGRTKPDRDLSADNGLRSGAPLSALGPDWRLPGQRFVRRPTALESAGGEQPEPAVGHRVAVLEVLSGLVWKDGHAIDDRFACPSIDRNTSRRNRNKVLVHAVKDLASLHPYTGLNTKAIRLGLLPESRRLSVHQPVQPQWLRVAILSRLLTRTHHCHLSLVTRLC